ncbi:hypothetical protein RMCBS344292_06368 [Rhizopus microsporus]|nr:hypothetical protein RMCBS344292_06368 [Rhizopus microsporus]
MTNSTPSSKSSTDTMENTDIEASKQQFTDDKQQQQQQEYNYKDDPDNPLNWSKSKKYTGFFIVFMMSFMGYFTSAVYMPATHDIMVYFNTNLTVINATIALYIMMNAIAPLFLAPLSERVGRRWVYIICMAIYTVCTIVCGISKGIGLFFAFRLLQGIFGSVGQAVGGGTVSDIFEPHERGRAMGIYMLGTILGPAIAPVIGGYLDQYLGWRWIFYVCTILGGAITIAALFFLKETLYRPGQKEVAPIGIKERLERFKFNPFASLQMLALPEVGLSCLPVSIAFGWFYYFVTILPATFGEIYGFSSGSIGLCYLAGGVGNVVGAIVAGFSSDKLYQRSIANNGGIVIKEFRLRTIYFSVFFYLAGSLMYGWFLQYRIFWFATLVGYALTTFGLMSAITTVNTYIVEAHLKKAASVVSSNNFARNTCAMIFSLCAVSIRGSLGDGWSYTFMGLMTTVSFLICIPLVQKYGPRWRELANA